MRWQFLCFTATLSLVGSVAEGKATPAKTAAVVAKVNEVTPQESKPQPNISDEMEAYRAIQSRKVCTVQDLADLLLMYRGEYNKYPTQAKRLERARELKLIKTHHEPNEELDKGTLAHALMQVYKPERGWLYYLTDWERYALRDVQEAGIMPMRATPEQKLSGEQLFAIMTDAEEYLTRISNWEKGE